jgi:hypothetical protein
VLFDHLPIAVKFECIDKTPQSVTNHFVLVFVDADDEFTQPSLKYEKNRDCESRVSCIFWTHCTFCPKAPWMYRDSNETTLNRRSSGQATTTLIGLYLLIQDTLDLQWVTTLTFTSEQFLTEERIENKFFLQLYFILFLFQTRSNLFERNRPMGDSRNNKHFWPKFF